MSLVPCELTGSSFSTPGSLPIPDLTPSHSIPISTDRSFKARVMQLDFIRPGKPVENAFIESDASTVGSG
jgi:hypothetical protein